MHEFGRALDVVFESEEDLADAIELAADWGLEWFGLDDPVHFEDPEGSTDPADDFVPSFGPRPSPISPLGRKVIETFTPIGLIESIGSLLGIGDHLCCKR